MAGHDVLAREAAIVGRVRHGIENFGGDDDVLARAGELLQRAAGDLFAGSKRVHVGSIEEVDACLDGAPYEGLCRLPRREPTPAIGSSRRSSCPGKALKP
jgi:hypothetical protein